MSNKRSREETTWCTIESDPGVFSLLIEKLGVKGVQVEEIYDLEPESLKAFKGEILGFIYLFKWVSSEKGEDSKAAEDIEDHSGDIFFAQQEISNACATQAILHILLNQGNNLRIELGENLENFRVFAQDLPPDMRGLCLSNSLEIREIHNEFGNLEQMLALGDDGSDDEKEKKGSKDPFHFVAFISKNDKIYELDGLKHNPLIHHFELSDQGYDYWTQKVLEIIKSRVSSSSDIRFNLMAVVEDRRAKLDRRIEELKQKLSDEALEFDSERPKWAREKFESEQELDHENQKWARYRKDWEERVKQLRQISSKGDALSARLRQISPKGADSSAHLSSKVQDLLKSFSQKGLI